MKLIIVSNITAHLDFNGFLSPFQHGFLAVNPNLNGKKNDVMIMDIRKAFDKVDHNFLTY